MENNGKLSNLGNGEVFTLGANNLDLNLDIATLPHNINNYVGDQMTKAEEILEKQDSIQIVPCNTYVLVKPYDENPYQKIEVLDGGLILPEREIYYKNPNSGEVEREENLSVVGHVLEVGPMVKHIKPGDDVFYRRVQGVPVPFFRQGLEVVSELSVQAIVNENLDKRFEKVEESNLIEVSAETFISNVLGETIKEKIENLKRLKECGIKIK